MLNTAPGAQSDIIRLMSWCEVARWKVTSTSSIAHMSASRCATAFDVDAFDAVAVPLVSSGATTSAAAAVWYTNFHIPSASSSGPARSHRFTAPVDRPGGQHPSFRRCLRPAVAPNLARQRPNVDRLLEIPGERGVRLPLVGWYRGQRDDRNRGGRGIRGESPGGNCTVRIGKAEVHEHHVRLVSAREIDP